jgi:hypothetical protein
MFFMFYICNYCIGWDNKIPWKGEGLIHMDFNKNCSILFLFFFTKTCHELIMPNINHMYGNAKHMDWIKQ